MTRQEQRDLDIEIEFLEGIVRRDPDYIEALQILGDDYTHRGKFAEGLQIDVRLAELRPEDPMVYYNLACSYALNKFYEEGIEALEHALNLGYRDFSWLAKDPDLRLLRKHPLYRRIRSKVRTLRIQVG